MVCAAVKTAILFQEEIESHNMDEEKANVLSACPQASGQTVKQTRIQICRMPIPGGVSTMCCHISSEPGDCDVGWILTSIDSVERRRAGGLSSSLIGCQVAAGSKDPSGVPVYPCTIPTQTIQSNSEGQCLEVLSWVGGQWR